MRPTASPRLLIALFLLLTSLTWTASGADRASAASPGLPASVEYWALGDSIAAGTGLGDDGFGLDLTPCRRSWDRSYPQRVAQALRAQIPDVQFPANQYLACSGARVTWDIQGHVDRCFQHYWWNFDCLNKSLHNQVNTLVAHLEWNRIFGSPKPTIVTISAGINDLTYTDPFVVYQAITWGDDWFDWFVQARAEGVRLGLTAEIARLTKYPNVTVVVNDVHNPFNTDSFMFHLPGSQCSVAPPPYQGAASYDCYERTEDAVHAINQAIATAVSENQSSGHVALASVHDLFHGHESPQAATPPGVTPCGYAPPGTGDTWVQYTTDPASNSNPFLFDGLPQLLIPGAGQWTGDCVHPNDAGAQVFANTVSDVIFQMMGQ